MNLRPYTVILLYPRSLCDGETQTYMEHVMAPDPEFAIEECRDLAEAANNGTVDGKDFEPLYVFEGHVESVWSTMI